jgi:hypothetical protein
MNVEYSFLAFLYVVLSQVIEIKLNSPESFLKKLIVAFFFGATTPIWAFAYLHETLRFTSVLQILDIR